MSSPLYNLPDLRKTATQIFQVPQHLNSVASVSSILNFSYILFLLHGWVQIFLFNHEMYLRELLCVVQWMYRALHLCKNFRISSRPFQWAILIMLSTLLRILNAWFLVHFLPKRLVWLGVTHRCWRRYGNQKLESHETLTFVCNTMEFCGNLYLLGHFEI